MLRARHLVAKRQTCAATALTVRQQQQHLLLRRQNQHNVALLATFPTRFSSGWLAREPLASVPSRAMMSTTAHTLSGNDSRVKQAMDELHTCRENGNWRQALKLLDCIDRDTEIVLDAAMYELAIAACARMGKADVLPGLLQNMAVDSILPTSKTVDYIMQAYLAGEHWPLIVELAVDVSAKGVILSDAAFQAAMEGCGKMRDAKSTKAIFSNIRNNAENGVKMDSERYSAMIRAAGICGRPDLAVSLLTHMEEQDGVEANADVFSQLIRSQIVNKALAQALQTFATANERELLLPEPIYTATIDALVKNKNYWQAVRLFDQMLAYGMRPSVYCFGRAMVAYVRTGKTEYAWACWKKIVQADESTPAMTKYARMVQDLAATNANDLTLAVFDHICAVFPSENIRDTTYALAIRTHGRLGNTQTAMDLFDQFITSRERVGKPMAKAANIYLSVFNALSRDTQRDSKQNTADAKRVWDIMVENVPEVLPPAYASLAGVFASSGELETLNVLLGHAEQNFASIAMNEASDEIDGQLEEEEEEQVDTPNAIDMHDTLLFSGVISGFAKARDDQSTNIAEYLRTMHSRGLPLNDSIIRASSDAFVRFQHWPLMMKLVDYVDIKALDNADLCFGDTISKLLDAKAWWPARHWISVAHQAQLQPPIRGKREALQELCATNSTEWRIAYALALETLSFKHMVDTNAECVADAVDVCMNAGRSDLAMKLFERLANHTSLTNPSNAESEYVRIPLRMYKQMILSLMREGTIHEAEQICAQMLQAHGKSVDGEALSLAISIKATIGDDDDVRALYETMQQLALEPNSYAENAAVVAYSRAGTIDKVLAIRDAIAAKMKENADYQCHPNVVKSILFSLALAGDKDAEMARTVAEIPTCTVEQVMHALLHANRIEAIVEFFDETVSIEMFDKLLTRLCDEKPGQRHDPLLAGALLLKFVNFHGLEKLTPANRVLKVVKALIQNDKLKEAEEILSVYTDATGDVMLKDMKPYFQRDVMEMLLYIYGEQQQFEKLRQLLDRKLLAFPLNVQHFEVAMEYCVRPSTTTSTSGVPVKQTAAVQCLKLFETLRHQFVKPNGAVYLMALQSAVRLGRLESTGSIVVGDVVTQGFQKLISKEMASVAAKAIAERKSALEDGAVARKKRGISQKTAIIASGSEQQYEVDVEELAHLSLFCHRNGIPITASLAKKLLRLRPFLPVEVSEDLQFILDMTLANSNSESDNEHPSTSSRVRASRPGAAGSRWGDLYLQPLPPQK